MLNFYVEKKYIKTRAHFLEALKTQLLRNVRVKLEFTFCYHRLRVYRSPSYQGRHGRMQPNLSLQKRAPALYFFIFKMPLALRYLTRNGTVPKVIEILTGAKTL